MTTTVRGLLAFYEQKYDESINFFKKSAAEAPDVCMNRVWLAKCYTRQNKLREAREELRTALKMGVPEPEIERINKALAEINEKIGKDRGKYFLE